jgi:hypothetical protein
MSILLFRHIIFIALLFSSPAGISLGGKIKAPVNCGASGSLDPWHVAVQLFNNVINAAKLAILWVSETLMAVPPQLNMENFTSHLEPLDNSMVSWFVVGRKRSCVSQSSLLRKSVLNILLNIL